MATRSELREKAMTILYQINLYKFNKREYNVEEIIKDNLECSNEFVKEIVYGVLTYYNQLIDLANENLVDWTVNRLDLMGATI